MWFRPARGPPTKPPSRDGCGSESPERRHVRLRRARALGSKPPARGPRVPPVDAPSWCAPAKRAPHRRRAVSRDAGPRRRVSSRWSTGHDPETDVQSPLGGLDISLSTPATARIHGYPSEVGLYWPPLSRHFAQGARHSQCGTLARATARTPSDLPHLETLRLRARLQACSASLYCTKAFQRLLTLNLRRDGRLSVDRLRDHQIATGFVGVLLNYTA